MIERYGKETRRITRKGNAVIAVVRFGRRVWEAALSCFGRGLWINERPWVNTEGWKNDK